MSLSTRGNRNHRIKTLDLVIRLVAIPYSVLRNVIRNEFGLREAALVTLFVWPHSKDVDRVVASGLEIVRHAVVMLFSE